MIAWRTAQPSSTGASPPGCHRGGFVETSGKFALAVEPQASVSTGEGGAFFGCSIRAMSRSTTAAPASRPASTIRGRTGYLDRQCQFAASGAQCGRQRRHHHRCDGATPGNVENSAGDIFIRRALNWTGSGDLTLLADGDVFFDASVSTRDGDFMRRGRATIFDRAIRSSRRNRSLVLTAADDITIDADVRATGSGRIAMLARTGDIAATRRPANDLKVTTRSGDLSLEASQGSVLLKRAGAVSADNIQVFSNSGDLDVTRRTPNPDRRRHRGGRSGPPRRFRLFQRRDAGIARKSTSSAAATTTPSRRS